MMAADTLGAGKDVTRYTCRTNLSIASYGSLARFKSIQRLEAVGDATVIGASGDMADFQHIKVLLDELIRDEFTAADEHDLGPAEIHEYLSRVLYARRSKMNPLWNSILVGGVRDGKKYVIRGCTMDPALIPLFRRFLSYVDLLGTTYSASTLATGYGSYIAQPLLRKAVEGREDTLTQDEARKIIEDCMRVLFYRDARSLNKVRPGGWWFFDSH